MVRNLFTFAALVAGVAVTFIESSLAHAATVDAYGEADVAFSEIRSNEKGEVEITYTTVPESLYCCPGANAKTTKEGIEFTFMRSIIHKNPKVTYPAKFVKEDRRELVFTGVPLP
jgi:hypothetical protein